MFSSIPWNLLQRWIFCFLLLWFCRLRRIPWTTTLRAHEDFRFFALRKHTRRKRHISCRDSLTCARNLRESLSMRLQSHICTALGRSLRWENMVCSPVLQVSLHGRGFSNSIFCCSVGRISPKLPWMSLRRLSLCRLLAIALPIFLLWLLLFCLESFRPLLKVQNLRTFPLGLLFFFLLTGRSLPRGLLAWRMDNFLLFGDCGDCEILRCRTSSATLGNRL